MIVLTRSNLPRRFQYPSLVGQSKCTKKMRRNMSGENYYTKIISNKRRGKTERKWCCFPLCDCPNLRFTTGFTGYINRSRYSIQKERMIQFWTVRLQKRIWGTDAIGRVAVSAHKPTPWFFKHAKPPDWGTKEKIGKFRTERLEKENWCIR